MIVTLTGNNSFTLQQRLNQLVGDFVAKHSDLALERVDGSEAEPQSIIDAVQSLPFLAERKMVVVRELGANKSASESIEQIIKACGETTDLILHEPSIDRRTAYFKVLKTQTQLEEFNQMDGRQLAIWLVEQAKKAGGQISLSDANYLVERVGANQQLLAMELDKLLTYQPVISRQVIELLTEPTPQSKIFDLLDAAFAGNPKKALNLYDEQRSQKVEPQAILAMLVWQLNIIALARLGKNHSVDQIAKDAGLSSYPVNKARGLASKMDNKQFKKLVDNAFTIDRRSKTTALDLDEALKTYIATL